METIEKRMQSLIESRSNEEFKSDWVEMEKRSIHPISDEMVMVRGLMIDDFERRFPQAFDLWMKDENAHIENPFVFVN